VITCLLHGQKIDVDEAPRLRTKLREVTTRYPRFCRRCGKPPLLRQQSGPQRGEHRIGNPGCQLSDAWTPSTPGQIRRWRS